MKAQQFRENAMKSRVTSSLRWQRIVCHELNESIEKISVGLSQKKQFSDEQIRSIKR